MLLILDDIHCADVSSWRLLQFMTRELADTHMLVIAAYRDVAEGRDPAFVSVLADLWREPLTLEIRLGGLTSAEVARYLELMNNDEPVPSSLAAELRLRTGGNPFMLRELVRLLIDEGGLTHVQDVRGRIPRGVQAAVTRRLYSLGDRTRAALTLAAVAGHDFTLPLLQAAGNLASESLLEQLERATSAGFISEKPPAPGKYQFAHALVRDALYAAVSITRRAQLHRQVGEAIEHVHGHDLDRLAELAHHFRQAGGDDGRRKAATYAKRAGEYAMSLLAYEEAARQFQLAAEYEVDPASRCSLLLAVAEGYSLAGDVDASRQPYRAAALLARNLHHPHLLAQALSMPHDASVEPGTFDPELAALLDEALTDLDDGEAAPRARLLARQAATLWWTPATSPQHRRQTESRCHALSSRAVQMARELDDPALLAYVLRGRALVASGPDHTEERQAIASELMNLAKVTADPLWELAARALRLAANAELADFDTVDADIAAYAALADKLRLPQYLRWVPLWQGLRAFMAGDLRAAERLADHALGLAGTPPEPGALVAYAAQLWMIRAHQDRLAELDPLSGPADQPPPLPSAQAPLAQLHAAMGRPDGARALLDRLATDGFAAVPRDFTWLPTLAALAETSVLLADTDHAATLYDLLAPYEARCATAFAVTSTGPVALHLGRLAHTLGRDQTALRHFRRAIKVSQRLAARPWLDQARHHLTQITQGPR